jgi:hypothetical protein
MNENKTEMQEDDLDEVVNRLKSNLLVVENESNPSSKNKTRNFFENPEKLNQNKAKEDDIDISPALDVLVSI